jgi:hypothetical protein
MVLILVLKLRIFCKIAIPYAVRAGITSPSPEKQLSNCKREAAREAGEGFKALLSEYNFAGSYFRKG